MPYRYPVFAMESLNPKLPQHVDLLGLKLVVWADSKGQWHCLEDKCPHRLAPLSEGRVEGDSIQCCYHGWTFDASGSCTRIPQISDPKAAATACASPKACVKAYPCKSEDGLLW
jgi:pheophorbide a oxygenase